MASQLKSLAFGILLFSWFVVGFMSHASSPNYRTLFWGMLPFALLHLALVAFFFLHLKGWQRACLAAFSSLALLSFPDLTTRVWLHFGLLSWLLRDLLLIEL